MPTITIELPLEVLIEAAQIIRRNGLHATIENSSEESGTITLSVACSTSVHQQAIEQVEECKKDFHYLISGGETEE